MVNLKLPDGEPRTVHPGTSFLEIAESFGPGFAKSVVAAFYDGTILDLNQPLPETDQPDHDLRFLTTQDPDALGVLRHSTAHILGCAILRLFPETQLGFGPATEAGYYYDVDAGDRPLTEDDFPAIEAEMAKIVKGKPRLRTLRAAPRRRSPPDRRARRVVQGRAYPRRTMPVRPPQLLPPR